MVTLSSAVHFLFTAYTLMLFARVMGSWFPNFQKYSLMRFVNYYTDPYLNIFRKVIPSVGMLDLSPLVAFFALQFFEKILLAFMH